MSNVKGFGAAGDGKTDDTESIRHAVADGDGRLWFPPGTYRVRRPIEIPLKRVGPVAVDGSGGTATVVMAGAGPAFRLVGTHDGTGNPGSVDDAVWASQRLPTVTNIEVTAEHDEADGFELVRAMQARFDGVLIRGVRHGIRLRKRNRNVLIHGCHVYHNRGVGIYFDRVNLHQVNIGGCHISYNRLGGIRVEGSEVRNLQITGNDVEYNNHRPHGTEPAPTAEVYVDTSAEGASVAELTIASNTLQATPSPDGANVRIIGTDLDRRHPPGLWTISGNVIGNQDCGVRITAAHAVTVSGNFIYSAEKRNLLVERSRQIVVGPNSFRRHTPRLGTGVRLVECADCTLSGFQIQDESEGGQESGASLLELVRCDRITVSGAQLLDGVPYGVDAEACSHVNVAGCTVMETRREKAGRAAVRFQGSGRANQLSANTMGRGTEATLALAEEANVKVGDNITDA